VNRLHRETSVNAPLGETFAFFADAANLERLTPSWLRFSIETPLPIAMQAGTTIRYGIRVHGIPIRWVSVIEVWEPGERFVDRQLRGPYRWWRHEHIFRGDGARTRVIDDVEYAPPVAWLAGPFVRRDVERIFDYRQRTLAAIFDGHRPSPR
jgi:ligand-binding SRPBCC domain-containing protein